ncbi:hypothetical protein LJC38_07910, partial [Parabacteroides sp. OttesenSCG-928-K15]|nr:hypothetical protein [Parabacteroides sp. OttesenSCG-928-K15]
RNHFIQRNMQLMEYIRGIPNYDPMTPPIKNLSTYLSDPTSGLKVLLAKGALNVLNSFNWDNQCNLVGAMYLSREYQIGDKVTIYLLYSYQVKGAWFDGTKECSKILTESDISSLAMPGCFNINKQTMPGLEQLTEFQEDVRNARFLICGVVEDRKKRTNSYVTLLPERSYILEIESQTITHIEEMIITFKDKELFAEKIANQALGGYALFNPLSPDEHYTVKGISKDENQHPVGLIFSPPAPLSYLIPLNGTDMGHIPLMKEGTTLALLENVLSPELGF